jgi:hypothetical protein
MEQLISMETLEEKMRGHAKTFASFSRTYVCLLMLLISMTLTAACATFGSTDRQPPLTVSEVIQMSKDGVPAKTIIEQMRASGAAYRLSASQLARLHDRGVSDQVLDYMQQTYLSAVRQDQRLEEWNYWTLGPDGFWYGGPYYGWPYGRIVVDRGGHADWRRSEGGEWHEPEIGGKAEARGAGVVGEHGGRK